MSDVTPNRTIIQVEDVNFGSAISSATGYSMAETINHQAKNQMVYVDFKFNNVSAFETGLDFADGNFGCFANFDIVGCTLTVGPSGTAGTCEIDVMRLTAPGATPSSIFSTTPKLDSTAGNYAYLSKNFESLATKEPASGFTHAVLGVTQLNEFDMLFPKIISAQNEQIDAQITIVLRIR